MKNIIPACKMATELIEKQQSFGLSFSEKIQLQMHLSICVPCTRYRMQSRFIDTAIKRINFTSEESNEK